MHDLTPSITLTRRQRTLYTILRGVLLAGFCAAGVVVALRILFPSAYYFFDVAHPRMAANTMNAPVRTADGGTAFSANMLGTYTSATVTLTLTDDVPRDATYTLTAHRGYDALFAARIMPSALTATITNHTPALGELFAYRDGIFTVDYIYDTKKRTWHPALRAIDNVRTFTAKGWSFDNVRHDITGNDVAGVPMGRMFTPRDMHPMGTVFRDRTDGTLYRLTQTTDHAPALVRVAPDTLAPTTPIVDADFTASVAQEATCTLTPRAFRARTLTCTLDLRALTAPGADIRFTVRGLTPDALVYVAVRLDAAHSAETVRASLGRITYRLIQHYTPGL